MQRTTLVTLVALLLASVGRAPAATSNRTVAIDVQCAGHAHHFTHTLDDNVGTFTDQDAEVTLKSEILAGASPAIVRFDFSCVYADIGHAIHGVPPVQDHVSMSQSTLAPIGKPYRAFDDRVSGITLTYTISP